MLNYGGFGAATRVSKYSWAYVPLSLTLQGQKRDASKQHLFCTTSSATHRPPSHHNAAQPSPAQQWPTQEARVSAPLPPGLTVYGAASPS